ncbi:hypothetical protein EHM69_12825, partial [candidate division KSB1 bacterium]
MHRNRWFLLLTSLILVAVLCVSAFAIDRAAIPEKYKWKTFYIYPSNEAWQAGIDSVHVWLTKLEAYKGTLAQRSGTKNEPNLASFTTLQERAGVELSRVLWHAYYNFQVDMADQVWTGRRDQSFALWSEFYERIAWLEPELLQIPKDTLLAWAAAYPALKPYQLQYADMFALRAHSLTEPEERILALASDMAGNANEIFTRMTSVDMDFPFITDEKGDSIQANFSGWREGLRSHPDRAFRERYFKALYGRYKTFSNTFAATITAQYKTDVFYARARKFDNTLQANLSPTFVPEEVYTNLIQTTRANLAPFQKYEAIRKRVLGLEHYKMWDSHVSLASAIDKRSTWEEAAAIVAESVKPLGPQFAAEVRRVLDPNNRFVDPFTSPGKITGAWSHNSVDEPACMIFNFDYEKGLTADGVTTIAHEVGHTMHANYTKQAQPISLRGDVSLTSEVPSTTGEALLNMKLLDDARAEYKRANGVAKEAARQKLIYLLDQMLMNGRDAFFREVMFAEWELKAHQMAENNESITQEGLTALYAGLLKDYYGPVLESDELTDIFWAVLPHFYLGYYVYSYAVGDVAATALATGIRAEYAGDKTQHGTTERYLNYLKSGTSKHGIDLLKDAGVDFTTSAPIEA